MWKCDSGSDGGCKRRCESLHRLGAARWCAANRAAKLRRASGEGGADYDASDMRDHSRNRLPHPYPISERVPATEKRRDPPRFDSERVPFEASVKINARVPAR